MQKHALVAVAALVSTMSGCKSVSYAVPHRIPLPPTRADSFISVDYSSTKETVTQTGVEDIKDCEHCRSKGLITNSETQSDAMYGAKLDGQPISVGQLIILGNPNFDADVEHYARESRGCRRGRWPVIIGIGAVLVGAMAWGIGAKYADSSTLETGGLITMGAGAVIATTGVVLGGHQCFTEGDRLRAMHDKVAADKNDKTYETWNKAFLAELAARFNKEHGH